MKKKYQKADAVVVEMSFDEHIAASGGGSIRCTYEAPLVVADGCVITGWENDVL